jgi:hypothetical protein
MKPVMFAFSMLTIIGCRFDSKPTQMNSDTRQLAVGDEVSLELASLDLTADQSELIEADRDVLKMPAKTGQLRIACHEEEKDDSSQKVMIVAVAEAQSGMFRASKIADKSCLKNMTIVVGKKAAFSAESKLTIVVIANGKVDSFRADRILQKGGGKWSIRSWRRGPSRPISNAIDPSQSVSNQDSKEQVADGSIGSLPSGGDQSPIQDIDDSVTQSPQQPPDCGGFPDGREICRIK